MDNWKGRERHILPQSAPAVSFPGLRFGVYLAEIFWRPTWVLWHFSILVLGGFVRWKILVETLSARIWSFHLAARETTQSMLERNTKNIILKGVREGGRGVKGEGWDHISRERIKKDGNEWLLQQNRIKDETNGKVQERRIQIKVVVIVLVIYSS